MHKARFCSLKETKILSDVGAADKNARSRKKVKGGNAVFERGRCSCLLPSPGGRWELGSGRQHQNTLLLLLPPVTRFFCVSESCAPVQTEVSGSVNSGGGGHEGKQGANRRRRRPF